MLAEQINIGSGFAGLLIIILLVLLVLYVLKRL
jgi:hypothetical protein